MEHVGQMVGHVISIRHVNYVVVQRRVIIYHNFRMDVGHVGPMVPNVSMVLPVNYVVVTVNIGIVKIRLHVVLNHFE